MIKSGKVYNFGEYCGSIEEDAEGTITFQYDDAYQGPPVSVTLARNSSPWTGRRLPGFFDGLIPEGWLLKIATFNFQIRERDRMELLLTVCGDCIGSASVVRDGTDPKQRSTQGRGEIRAQDELEEQLAPVRISNRKRQRAKKIEDELKDVFDGRCLVCGKKASQRYHSECTKALFSTENFDTLEFDLQEINQLAIDNVNRRLTVPGAQTKISLSPVSPKQLHRLTIGTDNGLYILKPPPPGIPDFPVNEHCIMSIAKSLGFNVAEFGLIPFASGEIAYITRRFDRLVDKKGKLTKVAVEDFGQIFDRNVEMDKYKGSYEQVGKWLWENADTPGMEVVNLFKLTYFSYLIGNNDLHLKNISVLTGGGIKACPWYDLVSTQLIDSEPDKELTLPIQGKVNKISLNDWLTFADTLHIPRKVAKNILKTFQDSQSKILGTIDNSFLPESQKEKLKLFISKKLRI